MKNLSLLLLFIISGTFAIGQEIEVVTQEKIQGVITILTYSPDGSLIASGSAKENSIKIWDINSGKIIGKLEGHEGATTALAFNKDGTKLVSSAKDHYTILWDLVSWDLIDSVKTGTIATSFVNDENDKDVFYSGSKNGKVEKWSWSNIQAPVGLFDADNAVLKLDASKTDLVSGTTTGKLTVYNFEKQEVVRSSNIHAGPIKGLRFIEDGAKLITTGGGGLVHIWNIDNLKDSKHLKASTVPITAFDANNKRGIFVVANQNKKISIFDFEGKEIVKFKTKDEDDSGAEPVTAISISPDGSTIASTGFRRGRSFRKQNHDNVIRVWDARRGTLHNTLQGTVNPIYTFDFNPERNELVTLGDDRLLQFWDFEVAERFGEFQLPEPKREIPPRRKPNLLGRALNTNPLSMADKIKNGNFGFGDKIKGGVKDKGQDIGAAVLKRTFTEEAIIKYSSKGTYLITKLPQDEIRYYTFENRKPVYQGPLWSYQGNINNIMVSPDEKYLAVLGSGDSAVSIINMETEEMLGKLSTPAPEGKMGFVYEANSMAFSPDGSLLAICFNTSKTFVFNTRTWDLVFENILPNNIGYSKGCFVNFSENGEYMVVSSMLGLKKYNTNDFNLFGSEKLKVDGHSAPMDKPSDYAITHKDNYIYFENLFTGDYKKTMHLKPKQVTHVSIAPNGNIGMTTMSGQFMLINPETGITEILLVADGENYIFKTDDNYYKVSKEGYDLVTFRIGNHAYPFEQFDAIFNRPDLVLKKLGCKDEELMNLYELAYEKRIKKLGLTGNTTISLQDIPKLKIENIATVPAVTENGSIKVNLNLSDANQLTSYNVWVNNVPYYGKTGKEIKGTKQSFSEEIDLIHGENKIQISCRNESGFESLMQTFYVEKTGEKPSRDLYLITIGTSNYKDPSFNLNYAVKDAKDLVALFTINDQDVYDKVHARSLFDNDVTAENIEGLHEFLGQSKPDDVVLVFVAGHGVLDVNFDYYFGTFDMDFNNPSEKGLAYERLEGILDRIKANKKILIMDTCHSGEIDKEDVFFAETTEEDENAGDVSFRSVGSEVKENSNATPSRVANELFNDLRRGTGATVISSAGGAEFAMESEEWKNGLFTYCMLNGLKNRTADLDGDGKIMLLELQEYVVSKVTALSHGKQIPNARMQNIELDFRIW